MQNSWKKLILAALAAILLAAASCGGGGANTVLPTGNNSSGGSGAGNTLQVTVPPVESYQDNSPATDSALVSWRKDCYDTLPAVDDADSVYQNASLEAWAEEILRLTNIQRANFGLTPLRRSRHLDFIAQAHGRDMALRDYFNHTAQGYNLNPFQRMDAVNSPVYMHAGENIAAGQHSPSAVVTAWMGSEGHRANILNPDFEYIGIGVYYDAGPGSYHEQWVQLFASFKDGTDAGNWLNP